MRKAVEKLLEKARKNNFPDDITKILQREDLSVDIIDRIYHYYDTNRPDRQGNPGGHGKLAAGRTLR